MEKIKTGKKLFVYFHGNTFDKYDNRNEIEKLVNYFPDFELFCFDAPYLYKNLNNQKKRSWLLKWEDGKYLQDKTYFDMIEYAQWKIENKMKEMNLEWKDVILCGRSQGSFVAIIIALQNPKCACLITLWSLYVDYIKHIEFKSNPKFLWVEMEDETVLDDERKNWYKILEKRWVKFDFEIWKKSNHDFISDETIFLIRNKIKEYILS